MAWGALSGFAAAAGVMFLATSWSRAAQTAFLVAHRAKTGSDDPVDPDEVEKRYRDRPWRVFTQQPGVVWRQLRLITTPNADPALESLRRRARRGQYFVYLSVPVGLVIMILFSQMDH